MKGSFTFRVFVWVLTLLLMASAAFAQASSKPVAIIPRDADVSGVKIHYLTAGQGPAVILLHGYTQTSRMWKPIIPLLAKKFTVIAPDLPGIGDSGIPKDGLDMKTSAIRIHGLAKSLGVEKARVVGHDIGLMVAYAYAAMYPNEVESWSSWMHFCPELRAGSRITTIPISGISVFTGPTRKPWCKDARRRILHISGMSWPRTKRGQLPLADRQAYVAAYSRPGRMRAGWAYFAAWPQTANDFAEMAKTKLNMPLLAIAGEKASAGTLMPQAQLVGSNVSVVTIKDSGHWVMEEKQKETIDALMNFL